MVRATIKITIDDHYEFISYYSEDYIDENPFIIFFKGPRRGAISMKLKSPSETYSRLLENRPHDFVNTKGFENWPFMSVYHWGEDPRGYWDLSVSFDAEGGHLEVSNISMTIYGTAVIPEAIRKPQHSCNESCNRGCSYINTSSIYCDGCQSLRMTDSLICVSTCPDNYCSIAGYCFTCPVNNANIAVAITVGVLGTTAVIVVITVSVVGAGLFLFYRKKKYLRMSSEGYTRF